MSVLGLLIPWLRDGAVQGQQLDSMSLVGPVQLSSFCDSVTVYDSILGNPLLRLASLASYFLPCPRSSWPLKWFFNFLISNLCWRFYSDQTKIPFLLYVLALPYVTVHHSFCHQEIIIRNVQSLSTSYINFRPVPHGAENGLCFLCSLTQISRPQPASMKGEKLLFY